MVHFDFFYAVVGPQVGLEVVDEKVIQSLHLFPIALNIRQNLGNEVVKLFFQFFDNFLAFFGELFNFRLAGSVVFDVHVPIEDVILYLYIQVM